MTLHLTCLRASCINTGQVCTHHMHWMVQSLEYLHFLSFTNPRMKDTLSTQGSSSNVGRGDMTSNFWTRVDTMHFCHPQNFVIKYNEVVYIPLPVCFPKNLRDSMNQVVRWRVNFKYYPDVHDKQGLGDVGVFLVDFIAQPCKLKSNYTNRRWTPWPLLREVRGRVDVTSERSWFYFDRLWNVWDAYLLLEVQTFRTLNKEPNN